MKYDLNNKELISKGKDKRIEVVTTVFEGCDWCEGTGLEEFDGNKYDCRKCCGYGEVETSKTKEVIHE